MAGSDAEITDQLPEDLDVSELVGPYLFPNTNRRRLAAVIYLVFAALCFLLVAVNDSSSLVNRGTAIAGVGLLIIGVFSLLTGWNTNLDETDALEAAAGAVGFPVGHASAQLSWRGWTSRPTWRALVFSAEDQPIHRGFVRADAVDGHIVESFVEDNPEDWAELG